MSRELSLKINHNDGRSLRRMICMTLFSLLRCHTAPAPLVPHAGNDEMFSAWASDVHEHVRKRNLLNRFKTRWLNLCAVSAFNAWCAYVDTRHRTRQLMQLTLTRLSNASLLRAFASWRAATRSVTSAGGGRRGIRPPISGSFDEWSRRRTADALSTPGTTCCGTSSTRCSRGSSGAARIARSAVRSAAGASPRCARTTQICAARSAPRASTSQCCARGITRSRRTRRRFRHVSMPLCRRHVVIVVIIVVVLASCSSL